MSEVANKIELVFEKLSESEEIIVLDRIQLIKEQVYERAIILEEVKTNKNKVEMVFEDLSADDLNFVLDKIEEQRNILWVEYSIILFDQP
jgi:hypothetical protein